ncbi:MAG: hypothetical protein V9E82_11370 [Candidatus Nanopelagicales bacterium]|jgi:hypothetical protein
MTDWAALIAGTQKDNPHLEPNLHDLLPLVRDINGEVGTRGMPYPATLRCIVALCSKAVPDLAVKLKDIDVPTPASADDLLVAYTHNGGGNWGALGMAAAAWLQSLQS